VSRRLLWALPCAVLLAGAAPARGVDVPPHAHGPAEAVYSLPRFSTPQHLALDGDGSVWITDELGGVVRLRASGQARALPTNGDDDAPADVVAGPDGSVWIADDTSDTRSFTVRDLDGDGEPEAMLTLVWNGANCCSWSRIYHYDPAHDTYRALRHFWGSGITRPVLRDIDGDGRPELVSRDDQAPPGWPSPPGSRTSTGWAAGQPPTRCSSRRRPRAA
jgi:hypothetical protein